MKETKSSTRRRLQRFVRRHGLREKVVVAKLMRGVAGVVSRPEAMRERQQTLCHMLAGEPPSDTPDNAPG